MKSDLPKVLHPVGPKPMIAHVVDTARALKPKKIVTVVGRRTLEIKQALGKDIGVAIQEEPRGTADAMKAARRDLPPTVKDIIVLYGDTPLIVPETVFRLREAHRSSGACCTVLTAILSRPAGYGRILRNDAGQFVGIIEDKDADSRQRSIQEINTGIYCFQREALLEGLDHVKPLNRTGEFYLTDIFSWLYNRSRKIHAAVADDPQEVLGVNSQQELMEAVDIIRRRGLARHMAAGVRIVDGATTFIDDSASIGPQTTIYPFTFIEKDVIIGRECSVGPFCHLREGAVLKDRVSVGNFTEIKNSTLDEGTFMRHMSYVGDAQIGRRVNVGAGFVIANFDGQKKHKTVVKDGAFLGCDAVLVAPVTVGRRAVVGAGSIVTKNHDVADGETVVGVPARAVKKKK